MTHADATDPRAPTHTDVVWAGPALRSVGGAQAWSYGYAFTDAGAYLEDLEIAQLLSRNRNHLELVANSLNGCFAVALFTDEGAILVSDRDGSVPFYSARAGDELVVSNDPWRVVDSLPEPPALDDAAVLDMLRLGYVAGNRTLAQGVTTMPPATVWRIRGHRVQSLRYWRFRVVPKAAPREQSEAQLAAALVDTVGSLADHLRKSDRAAAVALSDGLDARLWSALLARERLDDFRAFTYGARGDGAIESGARVAALLGVPHDRVDVSPSYLNDEFIDGAVRTVGFTTRFTCGAGIRQYDGSAVDTFVTGHGGGVADFGYGMLTAAVRTRDQVRRYLYWRHYQFDTEDLVPRQVFDIDYARVKFTSIEESLSPMDRGADPIGEIYRWELENRQRKSTLMELRFYEAQGRWMLPLHDHRITAYFASAPRSMLIGRRAYKDVAASLFQSLSAGGVSTRPTRKGSVRDPTFAVGVEVARRLRGFATPLFPAMLRRSKGFRAVPPEPSGADAFRYWFDTDDQTRDEILERVTAFDIPFVDNRGLRAALVGAQDDKIFTRMLPGAITVQAFSDLLRARRAKTRSASDVANA